jgi:small subunit ribosomal protein S3
MQIERRISFRRAMKKAIQITMEQKADGIKVRCAGRLGGAEISRAEWYREGKIPLHTLRTPDRLRLRRSRTTYGIIGIKCWICMGDKANETKGRRPPPRTPRRKIVVTRGPAAPRRGETRPQPQTAPRRARERTA